MNNICILNFNHIYEEQDFYENENYKMIDLTGLKNISRYCENGNLSLLRKKINTYNRAKINFIESGNYHYISYLFLERIEEPFTLVLFDHHTDMQRPIFNELISCGSWVRKSLDNNKYLKQVIIIGAKKTLAKGIDKEYKEKVICISEEDIKNNKIEGDFFSTNLKYPVYISIDKDVITKNECITDWDQGSLTIDQIEYICNNIKSVRDIVGADVCGEYTTFNPLRKKINSINDISNSRILDILEDVCNEAEKNPF